ncbi:MAG: hypothetical protein ABEJ59_02040 [Halanaeroarchaeum sp.]
MLDVPSDAPYLWIALLVASAAILGAVLSLPAAPPPDADRVAGAIDDVSTTPHAAASTIPLDAERVRFGPQTVSLSGPGGNDTAALRFGRVVPVRGGRLAMVLHGRSPRRVFSSALEYRRALGRARERPGRWRRAPAGITVRRVRYGEVTSVLVGR